MASSTLIRVGGVPEHFNIPWHQAIDSGDLSGVGLEVQWTEYSTGTGAMMKALSAGEQDVCLVLTEGAVADIVKGSSNRIVGTHVASPLTWGIHTRADSKFKTVENINGARYAVSRLGSGSHLMATVHAHQQGWTTPIDDDRLIIVNNMDGARESMGKGDSDVWFWEKFTTKLHVDTGEWARVGEIVTPWPCFVVAASEKALAEKGDAIYKMLEVVSATAAKFMAGGDDTIKLVSEKCGLSTEDAATWFSTVSIVCKPAVQAKALNDAIEALTTVQVITPPAFLPDLRPLLAEKTELEQ